MILKLSNVTFVETLSLGDAARRSGQNPIEPKKYLLAERDRVQLFFDSDERLLYVYVPGAAKEWAVIPAERCERLTPVTAPGANILKLVATPQPVSTV